MAMLQVVGIASILPFMTLLARPSAIDSNDWLRWLYQTGGFSSPTAMLVAAGVVVLLLFTLANVLSAITIWWQQRCAWMLAHSVSVRLVKTYTQLPYEFFLTHNSADLIRKVCADVASLVSGVLLAGSELIAQSVMSLVLVLLLVAVDPWLAVVSFSVLAAAYALIYLLSHTYARQLGEHRLEANHRLYKTFVDVISGIKAVKYNGAADFFLERFSSASHKYSVTETRFNTVAMIPRYIVETLALGGILLTVLYLLLTKGNLTEVFPVLSMFAIAAYRLLPSLYKAFTSAATLRHNLPMIDAIHLDIGSRSLDSEPTADGGKIELRQEIALQNVSFQYATAAEPSISNVTLTIPAGAMVGVVGSTGSGKTTLIDVLVGLLPPHEGRLLVDGIPIVPSSVDRWQRCIGYVSQEVFLFDDTILRNIAFGVPDDSIDWQRVREAGRIAKIDDFISNELVDGYTTTIGDRGLRLSGGQRQRIGLARAIYRAPSLLLLDEATNALDGITEETVIQAVNSIQRLTVIIVTHRLSTVKSCDRIYFVDQGRIAAEGTYDELVDSEPRFRDMVRATS